MEDIPCIPVRRLHNYIYCPRLMYFQFVENVFVYNADVADGEGVHRRVDVPTPGDYPEDLFSGDREIIWSLSLEDAGIGICGVVDLLNFEEESRWFMVRL